MKRILLRICSLLILVVLVGCKANSTVLPPETTSGKAPAETVEIRSLGDQIAAFQASDPGMEYQNVRFDEASVLITANGTKIYRVTTTAPEGYNGDMTFVVELSQDGTVTAVTNTVNNETPGKGSLCQEKAFTDQFVGRNDAFFVLKGEEHLVDGVSGATISSRASVKAISAAVSFIHFVISEGD